MYDGGNKGPPHPHLLTRTYSADTDDRRSSSGGSGISGSSSDRGNGNDSDSNDRKDKKDRNGHYNSKDRNYRKDLSDVRLGVYSEWFDDSHPDVRTVCRAALRRLASRGAVVVEISIPHLRVLSLRLVLS